MDLLAYAKSLLSITPKNRVGEDFRITKAEINEVVIPMYTDASVYFKQDAPRSKEYLELDKIFKTTMKTPGNANKTMVQVILDQMPSVVENLEAAYKAFDKTTGQDVTADGMTYSRANVMQILESGNFVSRFAISLMVYIYVVETAHRDKAMDISDSLVPAEIRLIKDNFISFCKMMRYLTTQNTTFLKKLGEVPNVVINEQDMSVLNTTLGPDKLDPFGMRFIPVGFNLIYLGRLMIAEWQMSRYRMHKETVRLAQLRKLNLEQIARSEPNAQVQKEIEYLEERIRTLKHKMADMEKA